MLPTIKTERLLLRPFKDEDLLAFTAMYADPDVMRYIGDGATKDAAYAKSTFERFKNHPVKGFGLWSAEQLSDGAYIGLFALKDLDKRPEIEIGYRFLKQYWGKGYATEGSRKLMEYGFETMGLKEIVAVTHFENKASQRVLEKCGLKNIGTTFAYGSDCRYFKKSMP